MGGGGYVGGRVRRACGERGEGEQESVFKSSSLFWRC